MRRLTALALGLALVPRLDAQSPVARIYHSMIPVERDLGHVVLSGVTRHGWTMDLQDAWMYNATSRSWRQMSDMPPGEFFAGAYDTASERLIALSLTGETWALDPEADHWERRSPSISPDGRCGHRMTYDPGIDRVILFGGFPCTAEALTGPWFGDTWAYDFDEDSWEQRTPAVSPEQRMYHAQAYDPEIGRVVVWGGRVEDNAAWSFDPEADEWVEHVAIGGPTDMLAYQGMAYEPTLGGLLVFGGLYLEEATSAAGTLSSETWLLDLADGTWRALSPRQSPAPRSHHTLVLDPARNTVLSFGGELESAYSGIMSDEVWTFDPRASTWVRMESR